MQGHRKFLLGAIFIIGGFVLLGLALFQDKASDVIAALAASFVSLSVGLGTIVYGNVQEHRSKASSVSNGNGGEAE